jgi:hypothetical protein
MHHATAALPPGKARTGYEAGWISRVWTLWRKGKLFCPCMEPKPSYVRSIDYPMRTTIPDPLN